MDDHSYNNCKKQLSLLIYKYFPQVDFRCILVNKNIVSYFFPFKDQIPLMMSSNIIYKYSCGQCQSSYIGETVNIPLAVIIPLLVIIFRFWLSVPLLI